MDGHEAMISQHEELIGQFYSASPYPPRTRRLLQPKDPALYSALISQAVGDFTHQRLTSRSSIWVIGCGVNQALITAMAFPESSVLGTDVSEESLRLCHESCQRLGITNLELRQEKLSAVRYREEFDYILCTGVLHHHPDPRPLLANVATAMRPAGVLEMMVYNIYHRFNQAAFQGATKLLGKGREMPDLGWRLARAFRHHNSLSRDLAEAFTGMDEEFADTWLNPFEQGYTIDTLRTFVATSGLILEAPRVTPEAEATPLWELEFDDPDIDDYFQACEDHVRWQITQLLLMEESPMMWFYLRRDDSPYRPTTDAERNSRFLESVPHKVPESSWNTWVLNDQQEYEMLNQPVRRQPIGISSEFQDFFDAIDNNATVAQICRSLAIPATPRVVRRMRALLAGPEFPYVLSTLR